MRGIGWDPSMSLFGPWNDPPDEFKSSGNAKQRRKALRKTGFRCPHGVLIVGAIDPEQKCWLCRDDMARYEEEMVSYEEGELE